MLEFLGLKDKYSESDLEDALLTHLADFLLELGGGFAFIAPAAPTAHRRLVVPGRPGPVQPPSAMPRPRGPENRPIRLHRCLRPYLNYAREN